MDRTLNPKDPGANDRLADPNTVYKMGGNWPVLVSEGTKWVAMPAFPPLAIAENTPQLPNDTRSRGIQVSLLSASGDEIKDCDGEEIEPDAVGDQVSSHKPTLPVGCK